MKTNHAYKYILVAILIIILPMVLSSPKAMNVKYMQKHKNDTKIVVLNYHKIDEMNISLSVYPKDFDEQMAYLKEEGYTTINPAQMIDNLENGAPLPEKPVIITFDDGYLDNYTNAYPILKKYGFTATIFVITDFISSDPRFMTWDQVRELSEAGFTIGSHTMQHKSLTDIKEKEIRAELIGSNKALEYQLGKKAEFFAYPTGTYNLRIAQIVKECGYKAAFTIKYGNADKASNIYALERVPIFNTEQTFKSFCQRLQYIPLLERLGWIKI